MNGLLKTKKINIYEKSLEEDIKKLKEIPYAYNEIQFFIDVDIVHPGISANIDGIFAAGQCSGQIIVIHQSAF